MLLIDKSQMEQIHECKYVGVTKTTELRNEKLVNITESEENIEHFKSIPYDNNITKQIKNKLGTLCYAS